MADGTDHSDAAADADADPAADADADPAADADADPDPDADPAADPDADSDLGPNVDIDGELCKSLTRAAEPLNSTAPDASLDDLDVIGESIADPAVIGMGEASHGTREFFLDVGAIPTESPIPAWCASEPVRYIIAGGPGDSPVNTVEADVRRQFDGIVFVRETTPARPVSTDS